MEEHRTSNERRAHVFSQGVGCWMWVVGCFLFLPFGAHAEQFDDIVVSAQAMHSGNTFHGYVETRVSVENRSPNKSHYVTLVLPNHAWGYGNTIRSLTRTVALGPGQRAIVPLLQPPLPLSGDGSIRVETDGEEVGQIPAPISNSHMSRYPRTYGGRYPSSIGTDLPVLLVSRQLDLDGVQRALNPKYGPNSAEAATGRPDYSGSSMAPVPGAWMPDNSSASNWLELRYEKAMPVESIRIYQTLGVTLDGEVSLFSESGTVVTNISMKSGSFRSGSVRTFGFSFPATPEAIKTVRLKFDGSNAGSISIDAVEISGMGTNQWADSATASSENTTAMPPGTTGPEMVEGLRAELPSPEWSEDWLAYSAYDAVALSAAEIKSLPPGVRSALWSFAEAGGDLIVFGDENLPAQWTQQKTGTAFARISKYRVGFGQCLVVANEKTSGLKADELNPLRAKLQSDAHYWKTLPSDEEAANSMFRVVEDLKVPSRGIVFIMLAFVLVIGPVNIIVLNRLKRRTWMLWTIPVIAFVTTLLVFVYSLLREGITPDARIAGVTVLDQTTHRATTVGAAAFYCPLTPSQGLRFSYDTEVTPLVENGFRYSGFGGSSGAPREVDWTQSQHLRRGWVSSRVPAHFHLRKSETRRERLQIENHGGALEVVNGLGTTIHSLWLADANGKIYFGQNVGAGQKAPLTLASSPSQVSEKLGPERLLSDVRFVARTDDLAMNAPKYLLPETYVAELSGNPFLENGLGSAAKEKRTRAMGIVFGVLDHGEHTP